MSTGDILASVWDGSIGMEVRGAGEGVSRHTEPTIRSNCGDDYCYCYAWEVKRCVIMNELDWGLYDDVDDDDEVKEKE